MIVISREQKQPSKFHELRANKREFRIDVTVGNVQALVTNGKAGFALKAHGYCLSTSLV